MLLGASEPTTQRCQLISFDQSGNDMEWLSDAGVTLLHGGIAENLITTASSYTIGPGDSTILVSGANETVTLPSAAAGLNSGVGRLYTIKQTAASGATVITNATGPQTIDGSPTYVLSAQHSYTSPSRATDGTGSSPRKKLTVERLISLCSESNGSIMYAAESSSMNKSKESESKATVKIAWIGGAAVVTAAAVAGVFGTLKGPEKPSESNKIIGSSANFSGGNNQIGGIGNTQVVNNNSGPTLDQIKEALKAIHESIGDKLWEEFPSGYVLFGGPEGGRVCMPFTMGTSLPKRTGKRQMDRTPTRSSGSIAVTIFQPRWKQENGAQIQIKGNSLTAVLPLRTNIPMPIRAVYSGGQPRMLFEVLDDDEQNQAYVIGFKK